MGRDNHCFDFHRSAIHYAAAYESAFRRCADTARDDVCPSGHLSSVHPLLQRLPQQQTNWRWYTYVAPVSWLTVGHVNDGRAELNFSVWGRYATRMKETRLRAICEQCEKGTTPIATYAFVHRDVKLSRDQVRAICEWTKLEGQRLVSK